MTTREMIGDAQMDLLEGLERQIKPSLRMFQLINHICVETEIAMNAPGELCVRFLDARLGYPAVVVKTQIRAKASSGRLILRNKIGDVPWGGWHSRFPGEAAASILNIALIHQMRKVRGWASAGHQG